MFQFPSSKSDDYNDNDGNDDDDGDHDHEPTTKLVSLNQEEDPELNGEVGGVLYQRDNGKMQPVVPVNETHGNMGDIDHWSQKDLTYLNEKYDAYDEPYKTHDYINNIWDWIKAQFEK